jgi:hypothetical protein
MRESGRGSVSGTVLEIAWRDREKQQKTQLEYPVSGRRFECKTFRIQSRGDFQHLTLLNLHSRVSNLTDEHYVTRNASFQRLFLYLCKMHPEESAQMTFMRSVHGVTKRDRLRSVDIKSESRELML